MQSALEKCTCACFCVMYMHAKCSHACTSACPSSLGKVHTISTVCKHPTHVPSASCMQPTNALLSCRSIESTRSPRKMLIPPESHLPSELPSSCFSSSSSSFFSLFSSSDSSGTLSPVLRVFLFLRGFCSLSTLQPLQVRFGHFDPQGFRADPIEEHLEFVLQNRDGELLRQHQCMF